MLVIRIADIFCVVEFNIISYWLTYEKRPLCEMTKAFCYKIYENVWLELHVIVHILGCDYDVRMHISL